jgi:hypothetical protein
MQGAFGSQYSWKPRKEESSGFSSLIVCKNGDKQGEDYIDPSPFCVVERGQITKEVILPSLAVAEGGSGGAAH